MHVLFKLALASFFIAACGGQSKTTVTQYNLQSTPLFCHPDSNIPDNPYAVFCANTSQTDDGFIRVSSRGVDRNLSKVVGAKPEWGVRKKITVEEYSSSNGVPTDMGGTSTYTIKLLSIDEEIPDPIGTRYTVALPGDPLTNSGSIETFGSGVGGSILSEPAIDNGLSVNTQRRFAIARINVNEHWYHLDGYEQPVYCAVSLCGAFKVGQRYYISEFTHAPEVFELVEIDGKRAIAVVTDNQPPTLLQ